MNDAALEHRAFDNAAARSNSSRFSAGVLPTSRTQTTGLTPEALADLQRPEDVRLAPSAKHVVYCLRPVSICGEQQDYRVRVGQGRARAKLCDLLS